MKNAGGEPLTAEAAFFSQVALMEMVDSDGEAKST